MGGGMGGGMMGGMGGGQRKKKHRKSQTDIDREAKEERERKQRELNGLLAGGGTAKETEKSESDADKEEGGPFKQVTKGYRWVAITGTLDHAQMLANYRDALKNPAIAHPQYLRLDLQRRTLQPDGTWSDWQKVDEDKNLDILDNIPATEEELAPENVRPEGLVDPLPFLNAGLWEKVHIASLVPKEKVQLAEQPKAQPGMGRGGMMGGMGGAMIPESMMAQMSQQSTGTMMQQSRQAMEGMRSAAWAMSGMGMGGMGSSESAGNFWKSEEKRVMIRALDFTAEPNNSYRYRVRIVVVNPNYNRDDVNPRRPRRQQDEEDPGGPLEQGNGCRDDAAGHRALRHRHVAAHPAVGAQGLVPGDPLQSGGWLDHPPSLLGRRRRSDRRISDVGGGAQVRWHGQEA